MIKLCTSDNLPANSSFTADFFNIHLPMTQSSVQNHQFLLRQLNDCMQACSETYAEAQQCGIQDARQRLEKIFTECYDLRDDLTIYSDQMSFANENDDYEMILARVEQIKRSRMFVADNMRQAAIREAFESGDKGTGDLEDDEVTFEGGDLESGLICPLTSTLPENPIVSSVCHHVFERAAIEDWIKRHTGRSHPQIDCPKAGCNAKFGLADLYVDNKICEQVERARRSREGTNDWEKI